jgi:GNAT superfamily N-acetyltransferase
MVVREAGPADAEALSRLLAELGYPVAPDEVTARLGALPQPALVADSGGVVGCLTWHVAPSLHRPGPVGRITAMVVDQGRRGEGIGRALALDAEARMRQLGCVMVEVASNMRRAEAHAFYERLGYARTSYKFAKGL